MEWIANRNSFDDRHCCIRLIAKDDPRCSWWQTRDIVLPIKVLLLLGWDVSVNTVSVHLLEPGDDDILNVQDNQAAQIQKSKPGSLVNSRWNPAKT